MARARQIEASSYYASTSTSTVGCSTYDVFLNFRGEDTRKGFTGHLYSALNRERINVFMDSHELPEGEEIGPKLMEAIQGSKISIPIFSKGYASSKWCLMELEKILECHKSNHQIVLPIFFDVEPSDVRHQSGRSFEKAFLDHERNFHVRNSHLQRVKRWREALSEVGNMKGWVLSEIGNGDESKLVELVVQRILGETSSIYLSDVKYPVGLDSHVDHVRSLLNIGYKDVRFVGICGKGGIGKTTIAKALYNLLVKSFRRNCFLENIREEAFGRPNGLVSLQEKLIYGITKREVARKILLVDRGKEEIRNRCQGVNVLLVLDDVDDRSQLEALAIDLKWLGQGSRVIITTRDEHALNVANINPNNIYRLKELGFGQSLRLFSLHAFQNDQPLEEYKELSNDVACYSGGLPLTLEVLGSYLSNIRNKEEWVNALQKLRASPHKEVYKKLKISYDNLEDGYQKAIFLDAACFFVGWKKRDVMSIWEACEYHPELAIKRLVQRSLLKFTVKEDSKEYLEMHDQIRDMGRQIVSEESCGMLGKRSRLWIWKEIVEVLEGHKGTENIEGILLPNKSKAPQFSDVYLSIECLEKMSSLRFLDIRSALSEGDDFPHLPYGLRWFSWTHCPVKVLRDDFYHKSLVHLDLSRSKIQLAWNSRPQNEYKKFQNLKVLNLSSCRSLYMCPDFSWFPFLERLDLSHCNSLSDLDESIGQLRHLKSIDLRYCKNLSKLPQSIGKLSHLKSLDLTDCSSLSKLPQSIGKLSHLKSLDLTDCSSLSKLPQSIGQLSHLESLNLRECSSLSKLPQPIGQLNHLKSLNLRECLSLSKLPQSIGQLSRLESLNLRECSSLSKLPQSIGQLSHLESLNLRKCSSLSKLPKSIGQLSRLESLNLRECSSLSKLPKSIGQLSHLESLNLRECLSLSKLPQSIGDLKSLVELQLAYTGIDELPDGVGLLEKLEVLDVEGCKYLVKLPSSVERMRSLHSIDLNGTSISKLPNDFLMLSSLVELNMSGNVQQLFNICPLPISCSVFSQLQTLRLFGGCESVESLPADLSDLKNLQELDLSGLEKLGYLPELPSSLITINCVDCKSLARLPDLSRLKILRTLYLDSCYKLEKIGGVEGMESLERFWVEKCHKVTHTPRKQYFQVRPLDYGLRRYEPLLFPGPRCLGGLRRLTNSSQRPTAGSDHLCLLESEGVRRDCFFSNANANANDGIRKRLSLIIVFAFHSFLLYDNLVQEGELVDIQFDISTDIFGKEGKRTNCFHTILIENVEFTTQRDIIYIHDLEGFSWFGFPLEGKYAMTELKVHGSGLYKLSDSGVYDSVLPNTFPFGCVELKFWSLEYVNEESGQALRNQEYWVDRIVKDILSGPWPHLDAAAGSHTLFHSHSALIEQDKRSDYYFGDGTNSEFCSTSFTPMHGHSVKTDCFVLEELEEDKRSAEKDRFDSHSVLEELEEDKRSAEKDRFDSHSVLEQLEEDKRSIEEIDSHPLLEEDKFSSACIDGRGSHSGSEEEEKSYNMTHPWELLLF